MFQKTKALSFKASEVTRRQAVLILVIAASFGLTIVSSNTDGMTEVVIALRGSAKAWKRFLAYPATRLVPFAVR